MCKNMLTVMMQENAAYRIKRSERETIHSGHFMVSYFDAEEQDDEYEVAVPVPEVSLKKVEIPFRANSRSSESIEDNNRSQIMSVSIETSLTKLFQCMSIAYRQKLTSPKWNRFKGVRLRWKDKIRLNNVIWRCWHMQFVIKKNTGVCQFACPLDVDIHNKPEAVVLEGKYWKRKLNAVTAEYKKWRLFYRNQLLSPTKDDLNTFSVLPEDWNTNVLSNDSDMMVDEDYMEFMSDTLFTTISGNQPFAFPDSRELARGTNLADLIQPSLVQLQPNLDFMDTLEPLHDLLGSTSKLPSVPEEYHPSDDLYQSLNLNYHDVSSAASSFGVSSGHLVTDGGDGPTDDHYIKDDPDNNNSPHQLSPINSTKNSYQTPHSDFNPYRNSTTSASSTLPSSPYISHHHPHYTSSSTSTSSTCNTVGNVLDNNGNNSDSNGNNNNSASNANSKSAGNGNDSCNNNYSCYTRSNSSSLNYSAAATEDSANYVINYSQNVRHPTTLQQHQQQQQIPHAIPINFSTSTMHSNSGGAQFLQCYSTEQTVPPPPLPSAYPPPINNYRCPTPSQSATSFPLKHTRSNSLVKNELPITVLSSADKTYPSQKQLSQHGRSRSGSSLLISQNKADTQCQNIQESVPPSALLTQLLTANSDRSYVTTYPCQVQRQYPQHRSVNSCNNINCDPRNNFLITGHRPVAYCTALIGRRSRTPDHILSGNANPVGYCKPRPPLLSSQCDDLINLSNRLYTTHENVHNSGENFHQVQDPRTAHHSTQSRKLPPQLDYSNVNKNQYQPTTQPTYQPVNPSNASTYTTPFIFTATHNNPHLEMANQLTNVSNSVSSPKNSISPVNSESLSPLTVANSPMRTTPPSPSTIKSSVSTNTSSGPTHYKEHRRVCHINAEQKRRCNIKNGFDTLHLLIPHLIQNPNTKMSKAAMLQKGAEYIRQLRDERSQLQEDIESLKQQIESLNSAISNCQSLLPATGAPVSRHRATKMKEMFQEYVKERTKQNWKFWILSLICEPLLSSFNASVSTASVEELFRTTIQWAEQYCSLVDLRPIVLNALRQLCTTTEILSEPSRLPEEVQAVVLSTNNEKK